MGENVVARGGFHKPLKVFGFTFISILSLGAIGLQFTGVLPSARQLPALNQEVIALGIPINHGKADQSQNSQAKSFDSAFERLGKTTDLRYLYLPPAKAANPNYVWKAKAKSLYITYKPLIEDLEKVPPDDPYQLVETLDAPSFSILYESPNILGIEAFAGHLANEGKFEEAGKLFCLCAFLYRWQHSTSPFFQAGALMPQIQLIKDFQAILAVNPDHPELKKIGLRLCDISLGSIDFGLEYRKQLFQIANEPASLGGSIEWSELKSEQGRAMTALNAQIVADAMRADLLRAYLAGYRIQRADPTSLDLAEKADRAVEAELNRSNSVTKSIAVMMMHPPTKSVRPLVDQIKILRKKFE